MNAIVIVGLPGSGKTTLAMSLMKDGMHFIDDASIRTTEEIHAEIHNNANLIIADYMLCDPECLQICIELIGNRNIEVILFENNKEQCIINSNKRINKKVYNAINIMYPYYNISKITDYLTTKNISYKIIKCYE